MDADGSGLVGLEEFRTWWVQSVLDPAGSFHQFAMALASKQKARRKEIAALRSQAGGQVSAGGAIHARTEPDQPAEPAEPAEPETPQQLAESGPAPASQPVQDSPAPTREPAGVPRAHAELQAAAMPETPAGESLAPTVESELDIYTRVITRRLEGLTA